MAGKEATAPEVKLTNLIPFAADSSMTVRELVWMALRHEVAADPELWLGLLAPLSLV